MQLAGMPMRDQEILELAAERLENAYDAETKVLALTVPEREAILRALADPPACLAELCSVLLREHELQKGVGLV